MRPLRRSLAMAIALGAAAVISEPAFADQVVTCSWHWAGGFPFTLKWRGVITGYRYFNVDSRIEWPTATSAMLGQTGNMIFLDNVPSAGGSVGVTYKSPSRRGYVMAPCH